MFILLSDQDGDWSMADSMSRRRTYETYLQGVRDLLPESVYEYATAPWHYDIHDHRCPHDAWVEEVLLRELSRGVEHERRELKMHVRLLGAYHDGHIEFDYANVRRYQFDVDVATDKPPTESGHGNWVVDEVRVSESGLVLHEVEFSSNSRWLIECREFSYAWKPLSSS